MNKTEHYNLNQWDSNDKPGRNDFNYDNFEIDKALGELNSGKANNDSTVMDSKGTPNFTTVLEWANAQRTSAICVAANGTPLSGASDAPAPEEFMYIVVGQGSRRLVIALEFVGTGRIYRRPIFHGNWNTNWGSFLSV
jgi:hypothetical protein